MQNRLAGNHHWKEGPGTPGGQQIEHEPATYPHATVAHGTLACIRSAVSTSRGAKLSPLLCTAKGTSGARGPALGPPAQQTDGHSGVTPIKGEGDH